MRCLPGSMKGPTSPGRPWMSPFCQQVAAPGKGDPAAAVFPTTHRSHPAAEKKWLCQRESVRQHGSAVTECVRGMQPAQVPDISLEAWGRSKTPV